MMSTVPPFDHRMEYPPTSTLSSFAITASPGMWHLPGPDPYRYFAPSGQEETKEEFDAAMTQWQTAMNDAMQLKAAEDERLKQESSWQARFERMIKAVTEF